MTGDPLRSPLLSALLAELEHADETIKRQLVSSLRPYLAEEPTRLLDASEKAKQLHLHPNTLVRMARAGRVPGAQKIGREWRFPAASVDVLPVAIESTPPVAPRSTGRRVAAVPASFAVIRGR